MYSSLENETDFYDDSLSTLIFHTSNFGKIQLAGPLMEKLKIAVNYTYFF